MDVCFSFYAKSQRREAIEVLDSVYLRLIVNLAFTILLPSPERGKGRGKGLLIEQLCREILQCALLVSLTDEE